MVQAYEHVSDATLSDILGDADMAAQVQMVVSGKMIGLHQMFFSRAELSLSTSRIKLTYFQY